MPARVEVMRGGRVESVHEVDAAVADGAGVTVAAAGDVDRPVFLRSAVKPFQALPLVDDGAADALGVTPDELAIACASHSGEPAHVAAVRSLLARAGVDESALACGPHRPFHRAAARALREAGEEAGRIHNNCSGKHAGMLVLARHRGWPLAGYHEARHPVQRRVLDEMARWTGLERDAIGVGVDGCGVATFAVPLGAAAAAFGRLAASAGAEPAGGEARVLDAMAGQPYLVAGTNRLCTALAAATGGRVVAKVGAEGVYGALARDPAAGVVLKSRDGARRAAEAALVAVLTALGWLRDDERAGLEPWARPVVRNTREEVVGEVRAIVRLEGRDG